MYCRQYGDVTLRPEKGSPQRENLIHLTNAGIGAIVKRTHVPISCWRLDHSLSRSNSRSSRRCLMPNDTDAR